MEKEKNLITRISESKLKEYKELCEKRGFTMSKRIRQFVENEIIQFKNEKHIK